MKSNYIFSLFISIALLSVSERTFAQCVAQFSTFSVCPVESEIQMYFNCGALPEATGVASFRLEDEELSLEADSAWIDPSRAVITGRFPLGPDYGGRTYDLVFETESDDLYVVDDAIRVVEGTGITVDVQKCPGSRVEGLNIRCECPDFTSDELYQEMPPIRLRKTGEEDIVIGRPNIFGGVSGSRFRTMGFWPFDLPSDVATGQWSAVVETVDGREYVSDGGFAVVDGLGFNADGVFCAGQPAEIYARALCEKFVDENGASIIESARLSLGETEIPVPQIEVINADSLALFVDLAAGIQPGNYELELIDVDSNVVNGWGNLVAQAAGLRASAQVCPDEPFRLIYRYDCIELAGPVAVRLVSPTDTLAADSIERFPQFEEGRAFFSGIDAQALGRTWTLMLEDSSGKVYTVADPITPVCPVEKDEICRENPIAFTFETTPSNDADGVVSIVASGGNPPFEFSLNDSPFQDSGVFENLQPGDYTAAIRDAEGCDTTFSVTVGTGVFITETEGFAHGIRVFPNPASEQVRVAFRLARPASGSLELRDLAGRALKFSETNWPAGEQDIAIKLNGLSPGLYFLSVRVDHARYETTITVVR